MDEYTAYCFDEACAYIKVKMSGEDKVKPRFKVSTKEDKTIAKEKHFRSAKDLYKSLGYENGQYKKKNT